MDYDVLIRGGLIVDGSGKPAYHGDVALRDGKIAYASPSGKIAGQDVIVDQWPQEVVPRHHGKGAGKQAYNDYHQQQLVFADIPHQEAESFSHVLRARIPVFARSVAGSAHRCGSFGIVTHSNQLLPVEIDRPRGKYRSFPSTPRGCHGPPHDRHPAR